MSTVKIKRSGTASSTPSSLDHGELAINYADATLFWKDGSNVIQSFVFQAYASATHASSHATGGSDALSPSDIGAAPAASPAITGNATFSASSGVPVTITNTGSDNSFVVNDASGDTTPFVVDASGRVGLGTAPSHALDVASTSAVSARIRRATAGGQANLRIEDGDGSYYDLATVGNVLAFISNTSERMRIDASGRLAIGTASASSLLTVNGVITVAATSGSAGSYAPSLTFSGDSNTGFGQVSGQSDTASIFTAGHERVRVRSNGDLNLGGDTSALFARLNVRGNSANTATIDGVTVESVAYWIASNGAGSLFSTFDTATGNAFVFSGTVNTSLGLGARSNRSGTNQNHENLRIKPTGAVRFVPLSADPASGEAGDVYYNSSTNKLRVYNGTSWVDLH